MSVIVKGMEMPKNCRTCPMLFDGHNYRWCNITGESLGIEETDNGRDEYCPLIELPPHGRLIDADALKERIRKALGIKSFDNLLPSEKTIVKQIDMASTIRHEPHWIPVTERLPENNDPVNVTWVNRNPEVYYMNIKDKPFTATAHYHRGHWYWYSSVTQDYLDEYGEWTPDLVDKDVEIIAWMPLPEPYKGVTE